MTNERKNPKVDAFLKSATKWQEEYEKLRRIISETGLTEDLKWGVPCYTYENGNVVLIHGFKDYCALLFVKGSLLKDPQGILIQQTDNVQAGRQVRFSNIQEIIGLESVLKAYVLEALEIEKAGLKVAFKKTTELEYPEEFQNKLDENPELEAAFKALTPGRQRAYNLFFSEPKLAKTRESRVVKYMQQILDGKGLYD
jgi:uncharacterized protein YdeI (YjbR/CyaY-like superfamily)